MAAAKVTHGQGRSAGSTSCQSSASLPLQAIASWLLRGGQDSALTTEDVFTATSFMLMKTSQRILGSHGQQAWRTGLRGKTDRGVRQRAFDGVDLFLEQHPKRTWCFYCCGVVLV